MIKRIAQIFLNNIGLKILSLIVAVLLWFHITGELSRLALEGELGITGDINYKITAKVIPVVADIRGSVPPGYRLNKEKIMVSPRSCNVIGLKRLLDKTDAVKTVPIDVTGYTQTVTMRVSLISASRGIKVIERFATVVIPIEDIRKAK